MTIVVDKVLEDQVTQGVNALVQTVAYNAKLVRDIDPEIKNLTTDIETFSARLVEASKNSWASDHHVLRVVVKKFRTVVNEAQDTIADYVSLKEKHIDNVFKKSLDKIPICGKINEFARDIQTIRGDLAKIRQEHGQELLNLMTNKINEQNKGLLTLQIERPIGFDKAIKEVEQAVNMLVQSTVGDNVNLVSDIMKSDIEDITSKIKTFNESLVVACKSPLANQHRVLRVIVKKFGRLVNEAGDAVANYYLAQERKHGLAKAFDKIPLCGKLNNVGSEIQSIKDKVKTISDDHKEDLRYLQEDYNKRSDLPPPKVRAGLRENKILGFNKDFEIIKTQLLKASNEFDVIPIVGNAGTGKTTFALKIFEDLEIRKYFTKFIWVHVSQVFHRRQKFIDILHQIWKQTKVENLLEDDLEAKVKDLLMDQKYFIVLDDVHVKDDWDCLKGALPENSNGSRVVVTTLSDTVVDSTWNSYSLGKLSIEDGWLLIKNDVFGTEGCCDMPLIEELGKKIVEKCNGLQHAILLVTGILRNCITCDGWQQVANNLLEINGQDRSYHGLVKLCYDDLPNQGLKHCFLYFAYFSMGYEIVAWKLIRLWIAEGFIPERDEWGHLLEAEVEAWKYLNVLVDRNLVMVKKRRADGEIKTCCIHDTLHEFCISEVEGVTGMTDGKTFGLRVFYVENNKNPSDSFSNLFNQRMGPRQRGDYLRSFLVSSSSQNCEIRYSEPEMLENTLRSFKYLMVLNVESLKYRSLRNVLYSRLRYIRYLAITVDS